MRKNERKKDIQAQQAKSRFGDYSLLLFQHDHLFDRIQIFEMIRILNLDLNDSKSIRSHSLSLSLSLSFDQLNKTKKRNEKKYLYLLRSSMLKFDTFLFTSQVARAISIKLNFARSMDDQVPNLSKVLINESVSFSRTAPFSDDQTNRKNSIVFSSFFLFCRKITCPCSLDLKQDRLHLHHQRSFSSSMFTELKNFEVLANHCWCSHWRRCVSMISCNYLGFRVVAVIEKWNAPVSSQNSWPCWKFLVVVVVQLNILLRVWSSRNDDVFFDRTVKSLINAAKISIKKKKKK